MDIEKKIEENTKNMDKMISQHNNCFDELMDDPKTASLFIVASKILSKTFYQNIYNSKDNAEFDNFSAFMAILYGLQSVDAITINQDKK